MTRTAWTIAIALSLLVAACSGGGGEGDSAETSTVTGVVRSRSDSGTPVAGATVSVFGTSLSVTTDSSGGFVLENVPNGDRFFVATAEGSWGTVDYWVVPEETGAGVDLGVIADADIASLAATLGRSVDPADGVLDMVFYEGASGGETAALSASSDPAFTFDLEGTPVEQPGLIAGPQGDGELIYTGIDTADGPVTATVAGVSGVTSCFVNEAPGTSYPIIAKAITIAYAFCEPAQ